MRGACRVQFASRAEARVGEAQATAARLDAAAAKPLDGGLVDLPALALPEGPLVPAQAKPVEVVHDEPRHEA